MSFWTPRGDGKGVARLRAGHKRQLREFFSRHSLWIAPMIAEPVFQALHEADLLITRAAGKR